MLRRQATLRDSCASNGPTVLPRQNSNPEYARGNRNTFVIFTYLASSTLTLTHGPSGDATIRKQSSSVLHSRFQRTLCEISNSVLKYLFRLCQAPKSLLGAVHTPFLPFSLLRKLDGSIHGNRS